MLRPGDKYALVNENYWKQHQQAVKMHELFQQKILKVEEYLKDKKATMSVLHDELSFNFHEDEIGVQARVNLILYGRQL